MFTTAVNGTSTCLCVGGTPGSLKFVTIRHMEDKNVRMVCLLTYSQSSCLSWVNLKMNSSTTLSIPRVRLISSRSVSSELLKMKLCR
jgi:hypothetical protein